MKKLNIGVIGAGRIGKLHAEILIHQIPEANVVKIADPMTETLTEWTVKNNIDPKIVIKDYKEILKDPTIEAVVICSPTNLHAQMIIEAAQAGKQIFCEKPIDHDLKKIADALEAVKKAGVFLQIGFNRRFDHNFLRVRNLVKEGKIGKPQIVKITSRDPSPPPVEYVKVSGGLFLDMTIHDFDMARYLVGEEVEEVYAVGGVLVDKKIGEAGDIDTAVITLKYKSGAMGIIDNCRQAVYGYDQRVEVFGSGGCLIADNDKPNTAVLYNAEAISTDKIPYFFLDRYTGSYKTELEEFVKVVKDKKTPSVGGIDGLNAVIIGLAAKKSLEEKRPVKLSEIK